jgi:ferredoxin-NADP reductase
LTTVVELVDETARTRTLVLDAPLWPGHRAGQHVDVRLTAEDGYQAQRSYSIASAPCGPTGFVEGVAEALVALGHDPARIRTERFGPTGG